jgi:UPF0176 protein
MKTCPPAIARAGAPRPIPPRGTSVTGPEVAEADHLRYTCLLFMATVINISVYKFVRLQDLETLRLRLQDVCTDAGLKGTILLSHEGINVFAAGSEDSIALLIRELRAIPGLEDLEPKRSESIEQPFRRMLVKIKKEIIAFGVEGIDPASDPAPKVPPRTLKQWLDEGRPVTLLDTRNDYEVRMGTFHNALPAAVETFREFPEAVRRLPEKLKDETIVMFCTGGIRCEKAGPYMRKMGFRNVLQLDGGILKYFEECGGAHYEGECFVFDHRVGVDPELRETRSVMCFKCQMPLSEEQQRDPRYVYEKSCPYCAPAEPDPDGKENVSEAPLRGNNV